jgi:RNA polymerase sigma factor (sigma-70 family)
MPQAWQGADPYQETPPADSAVAPDAFRQPPTSMTRPASGAAFRSVQSAQPLSPAPEPRSPLDVQSTIELTRLARGGDQAAVEALCLRCLQSLSRYAAGRLPGSVRGMLETQDVVQEAVERGMSRLNEFEVRHSGALIAYMRKIFRNLIIDYLRTHARRAPVVALDDRHADRGRSPLEAVLDEEQIELYEAALERLKPRDAALVTLKIDEQLGYDDIAIELGFPTANAARVAARRAVLRLAHEMSRLSRTKSRDAAASPDVAPGRDLR